VKTKKRGIGNLILTGIKGGEILRMKEAHKQCLYADLNKYADQIGILPEETPRLILDRQEYSALRKSTGYRGVRHNRYGECNHQVRTIFVNARQTQYQRIRYLTKIGRKRTGVICRWKTVKATYRDKLNCLVHELVHYRFPSMPHGWAFEKRIKEVLSGTTFLKKHIDIHGKLHDV
jgi:hypothetical protein